MNTITRLLSLAGLSLALSAFRPAIGQEPDGAVPGIGNWGLVCNEEDSCKSSITLPIDTGGEMEVWVGKEGDTEYLGVISPLGIHIPSGVVISFDRGTTAFAMLNLVDCKPVGCRAVIGLAPALEENLRERNDLAVVIRGSDSREITGLLVTLKGFTASLEKLRTR